MTAQPEDVCGALRNEVGVLRVLSVRYKTWSHRILTPTRPQLVDRIEEIHYFLPEAKSRIQIGI